MGKLGAWGRWGGWWTDIYAGGSHCGRRNGLEVVKKG